MFDGSLLEGTHEGKPKHLAAHNLVTFHNLTHLEVTVKIYAFSLHDVLDYMPNLEVIVFEFKSSFDWILWHPRELLPNCLLSCLGMIQFKGFSASKGQICKIPSKQG